MSIYNIHWYVEMGLLPLKVAVLLLVQVSESLIQYNWVYEVPRERKNGLWRRLEE